MSSQKLIVVLGATGNQGGSVVNTFLSQPQWRVRGVTRDTKSAKARSLAERGVEVVAADLNDKLSLQAAFTDAQAIFIVSDYWGIFGSLMSTFRPDQSNNAKPLNLQAADIEKQQLVNAFDAAAQVPTLERLVFSSLQNVSKWSGGKYEHVYHFEFKARAGEYAAEKYPELWAKTSIFQAGWFLSNYKAGALAAPVNTNGTIQFISNIDPDVKLPLIAAEEDTGPLVKSLFESAPGKNLIAYRGWMTLAEMVAAFTEATRLPAECVTLPAGQTQAPFPEMKLQIDENWAHFKEIGYEARDDPSVVHTGQLDNAPGLGSVVEWFKGQDWGFVSEAA